MKTIFNSIIFSMLLLMFSAQAFAGDPFSGSNIYAEYCVSCHGGDGRGEVAGVPSFRGGALMTRSESDLINSVKSGRNLMPGFGGVLEEYQIDDVVTYIRTFN